MMKRSKNDLKREAFDKFEAAKNNLRSKMNGVFPIFKKMHVEKTFDNMGLVVASSVGSKLQEALEFSVILNQVIQVTSTSSYHRIYMRITMFTGLYIMHLLTLLGTNLY